ncbi:MAG: hypothetical protein JW850_13425 [Thermoflexales bacterium]|nr:hypothetical protein [Thermoflexales bacterium]
MQRKLSKIEKIIWTASPIPPLNYCLAARISGTVSKEALLDALQYLRQRFPSAFVRVLVDGDGQAWEESEGVPDAPLRVRDGCEDMDWQHVIEEELGEPFDLFTGPAFRLTLVRGIGFSDLVLTVHHGLADGVSGVYLLYNLLGSLGDSHRPIESPILSPDLFDNIPRWVRAHPRVRAQDLLLRAVAPFLRVSSSLHRDKHQAAAPPEIPPPWKRFRVLTAALTPAQTAKLVAECKRRDLSVHAAVCAAWLKASALQGIGGKKQVRKISSPINLRQRLSVPVGEAFGPYMSNIINKANCAPERDFWEVARQLMRGLTREAAGERPFMWILMMEASTLNLPEADLAWVTSEFSRKPIDYDFSISNLGRLNWPSQFGTLEVQAVYGPAVNTSEQEKTVGIITFAGQMTFTFTFRDFVIDADMAEQLLALALRQLFLATDQPC